MTSEPTDALLPFSEAERVAAGEVVGSLLARGCVEFCCVGTEAEQLHDSIDAALLSNGAKPVEACEYFLLAAGGDARVLLALVADHPALVAALSAARA